MNAEEKIVPLSTETVDLKVPTDHKGRLLREILEGKLALDAQGLVRFHFALSVGEQTVGICKVVSTRPKCLALTRAWNRTATTWCPFAQLHIPSAGRQLTKVQPGTALFLVEFTQGWSVLDRVAFRGQEIVYRDVGFDNRQDLMFEQVEVRDVEILG